MISRSSAAYSSITRRASDKREGLTSLLSVCWSESGIPYGLPCNFVALDADQGRAPTEET